MSYRATLSIIVTILFLSSGCLDSLENEISSGGFWGDDCQDDLSDCPASPAPDFDLVDQYGEPVNMSQFDDKIIVMTFVYTH